MGICVRIENWNGTMKYDRWNNMVFLCVKLLMIKYWIHTLTS